jgi:hypothetical protein
MSPEAAGLIMSAPAAGLTETARELSQHLADLHAALKQLAELATEKLAAMRRADTDALNGCAEREEGLLRTVLRDEQGRNAILARLAQSLHCPQVRLTEIVDRLPEPVASALRARSVALKEIAGELQRRNRLAASVAQNLQAHIRGIFADVASANRESLVYGPRGQHEMSSPRRWVDAVG